MASLKRSDSAPVAAQPPKARRNPPPPPPSRSVAISSPASAPAPAPTISSSSSSSSKKAHRQASRERAASSPKQQQPAEPLGDIGIHCRESAFLLTVLEQCVSALGLRGQPSNDAWLRAAKLAVQQRVQAGQTPLRSSPGQYVSTITHWAARTAEEAASLQSLRRILQLQALIRGRRQRVQYTRLRQFVVQQRAQLASLQEQPPLAAALRDWMLLESHLVSVLEYLSQFCIPPILKIAEEWSSAHGAPFVAAFFRRVQHVHAAYAAAFKQLMDAMPSLSPNIPSPGLEGLWLHQLAHERSSILSQLFFNRARLLLLQYPIIRYKNEIVRLLEEYKSKIPALQSALGTATSNDTNRSSTRNSIQQHPMQGVHIFDLLQEPNNYAAKFAACLDRLLSALSDTQPPLQLDLSHHWQLSYHTLRAVHWLVTRTPEDGVAATGPVVLSARLIDQLPSPSVDALSSSTTSLRYTFDSNQVSAIHCYEESGGGVTGTAISAGPVARIILSPLSFNLFSSNGQSVLLQASPHDLVVQSDPAVRERDDLGAHYSSNLENRITIWAINPTNNRPSTWHLFFPDPLQKAAFLQSYDCIREIWSQDHQNTLNQVESILLPLLSNMSSPTNSTVLLCRALAQCSSLVPLHSWMRTSGVSLNVSQLGPAEKRIWFQLRQFARRWNKAQGSSSDCSIALILAPYLGISLFTVPGTVTNTASFSQQLAKMRDWSLLVHEWIHSDSSSIEQYPMMAPPKITSAAPQISHSRSVSQWWLQEPILDDYSFRASSMTTNNYGDFVVFKVTEFSQIHRALKPPPV